MELSAIQNLFAAHHIDAVGVLPFGELPPLLEVRSRSRLPENPGAVIFCLFPYYTGPCEGRNISRYTVGPDYHTICGDILRDVADKLLALHPGHRFVPFVDASPIPEVEGAYRAGLGRLGENGQIIHPRYGSYVFVGEIVTDLMIPSNSQPMGPCLRCGKCVAACPTGALQCSGKVEERLCRSHITQKKGELTPWEREQIRLGAMVWGCDICTDVCPLNESPESSPIPAFHETLVPVLTAENLSEHYKEKALGYRGKPVLLRNLQIIGDSHHD